MSDFEFFSTPTSVSQVKINIVLKYFQRWYKVMIPRVKNFSTKKIAYIDLFSGPGVYENGFKSTPIRILEKAIEVEELRSMLVTLFNDAKKNTLKF